MNINPGRSLVSDTLLRTLKDLLGKPGVTERDFATTWLSAIGKTAELTENGWYEPPPDGVAVYSAPSAAFGFASLRTEEFWPGSRIIDWSDSVVYFYASPVDIDTGLMADLGVTLYFGADQKIRDHVRRCVSLTKEVVAAISSLSTSRELFRLSEAKFAAAGYWSNVRSVTDVVPVDLGHTVHRAEAGEIEGHRISDAGIRRLTTARKYINEVSDWELSSVEQFTVEPSLAVVGDTRLPQISTHYIVEVAAGSVVTVNEACDQIYEALGLL